MQYGGINLRELRKTFYSKVKARFEEFKNFDQETVDKIRNDANNYQNANYNPNIGMSSYYINTLTAMNKTTRNTYSIDEKLAFLIETLDPSLRSLDIYLEKDIITLKQIEKEEDEMKKEQLSVLRDDQLADYEHSVREELGFFDPNFKFYENKYRKNVLNKLEEHTREK